MASDSGVIRGADGKARCYWCDGSADYRAYHDGEWGRPVADDVYLFEKICLDGFQSGLSWLTILRKRENFRRAFAGFDFHKVARFITSTDNYYGHKKITAPSSNGKKVLKPIPVFQKIIIMPACIIILLPIKHGVFYTAKYF